MRQGFETPSLSVDQSAHLAELRRSAAADIVRLVSLSASGHPGGSLSSLDALLVLYASAALDPAAPHHADRDRLVVSHGHISPGVYATLAGFGYFDIREAFRGFRRAGSVFGGHVESVVPGVEWNTGNLGQGLSVGAGFAMAARARGASFTTFVGMGDGEQQKGQIGEARRFAVKYKLNNLVAFIDFNGLQIGGKCPRTRTGTRVRWWADKQTFTKDAAYDREQLRDRAIQSTFLVPGLKITVRDFRDASDVLEETFQHKGGIGEYVESISTGEPVCSVIRLQGSGHFAETVPVLDDKGHMH